MNRPYDWPTVRLDSFALPMSSLMPRWLQTVSELALRVVFLAGFLILVGLAIDRLRLIFLPMLAALILSAALLPAKHLLTRRGIPNAVAAITVVVSGLAVLGLIGYFTISTLTSEFADLEVDIEAGFTEVLQSIGDWAGVSDEQVDEVIDDVLNSARGNADTIAGGVFSGVRLAAELLAGIILLAVLTFLLVKDAESMQRGIARRLGRNHRRNFLVLSTGLFDTLGKYFRGVTIVAFMDALLIGIGLVIIGIPFALPLAVLTFFGAFIPVLGRGPGGIGGLPDRPGDRGGDGGADRRRPRAGRSTGRGQRHGALHPGPIDLAAPDAGYPRRRHGRRALGDHGRVRRGPPDGHRCFAARFLHRGRKIFVPETPTRRSLRTASRDLVARVGSLSTPAGTATRSPLHSRQPAAPLPASTRF